MGDPRRNDVFAAFIQRNFPRAKSVLCVADGRGELAAALCTAGRRVRVIEAQPRCAVRAKRGFRYQQGQFTRSTPVPEDLVVGMHPDEATEAIILAAKAAGKPFAVVPCCHTPEHGGKACVATPGGWRNHLMALWPGALSTELRGMAGRNVVIWHRGGRR